MSWRNIWRLFFVTSALFLFSLPVSASTLTSANPQLGASDPSCANESTSKSISSTSATSFTIINHSTVTVTLYWLDFSGKRVKYFDLAPGATANQPTYRTHPWVIAWPDGVCLQLFTVTDHLDILLGQKVTTTPTVDLSKARLEGLWRLRSSVTAVAPNTTGSTFPPGAVPPVGTKGYAFVKFVPNCARPTACDLNTLEAVTGSADGSARVGGLAAPGVGNFGVYTHSANTYTFLPAGFGTSPCSGTDTHYFPMGMTLNVTAATQSGDTLLATKISGSGRMLGASCINGSTIPFFYFLAIDEGIPMSAIAPPSTPSFTSGLPSLATVNSSSSQPPISKALVAPLQAFSSPAHTLLNIVLAAGVVLFITFPAQLFNHTLEENWAEIRRRGVRFLHLPKRFEVAAPIKEGIPSRSNSFIFFLVIGLGTLLGALLNPHFGVNLPTFLALIATLLTIAWGLWLSYNVAKTYRNVRHTPVSHYFKALPAGLVVAGVCVLVSRLTDFQPGYLYGLVYSVAFTGQLAKHQEGQLITLSTLVSLALAVLAWLAWAPLHSINVTGPLAIPLLLATSILASIFVGGLVGSIIGLIPIRFLSGHKLFTWRRTVWAATFGLAVFLFLQVLLLPAQGGHSSKVSLLTAVTLLLVFGVISVAFWWYFARRKHRIASPASAAGEAEPDEHTVGIEGEATEVGSSDSSSSSHHSG